MLKNRVTIRNNGFTVSHKTVVRDPIPAGVDVVPGTISIIDRGGNASEESLSYNSSLKQIEAYFGDMDPAAYRVISFSGTVNRTAHLITNQADFGRDTEKSSISTAELKHKSNIVEHFIPGGITVLKKWTGDADDIASRPASVRVHLLDQNKNEIGSGEMTVTNGWSYTWTGDNIQPDKYTYYVYEDLPDMYDCQNYNAATAKAVTSAYTTGMVTLENEYMPSFDKHKNVYNTRGEDINEQYVAEGEILTYTITFSNPTHGTKLYDIEDALPQCTTFVSADNGGSNHNGTVKWSRISVEGGGSGSVSMKVRAEPKSEDITTIKNIGKVWMLNSSGNRISKTDPNTNEVTNYVVPAKPGKVNFVKTVTETAKLSSKNFNTLYVRKGDVLYYHITTSSLPKETDFVLTDTIPDGMEYVSGSADNSGTYDEASHTVTWNLHITEASSLTVTFAVKVVVDSGDFDNSAFLHIGSGVGESNHVMNEAALLKINKQITNALAAYGAPSFVYKIVGSDGTLSYRMVQIADAKDNAEGTTSFAVPTGTAEGVTYEIAELKNARYQFDAASSHSSNVEKVSDNLFRFSPKKRDRSAELNYKNTIQKWNKISHENSVINHVPDGF